MAYRRSALEEAAYFLGARRRTEQEVRDRLADKGYEKDETEAAIAELKAGRYIDDYEYAYLYAELSYGKRRASGRIICELTAKGVSGETAANAVEDYRFDNSIDERKMALEEARRLRGTMDIGDEASLRKARGRIARRLDSAGFTSGDIISALDELGREE